ncbi:MAG TPA: CARDB domain-containing protein [Steroidobacteraceae bacterium]|jgi:hypothetical protein|nr:CARDB domain-containing protein [Steroidobacteraceae bacterium]
MNRNALLFAAALVLGISVQRSVAQQTQLGIYPVPTFTAVTVQTAVSFDPSTAHYFYNYTVTNPASNTGTIYSIEEDLTAPLNAFLPTGSGFTLPRGAAGPVLFDNLWAQRKGVTSVPFNQQAVPFGSTAPSGWLGTLSVIATGGWHSRSVAAEIPPGQTLSGFNLVSYGSPTIRAMTFKPEWILDLGPTGGEPTDAQAIQAAQIKQSLQVTVFVLGPSVYNVDIGTLLSQLAKDVATAVQLGWISDATLAAQIQSQIHSAQTLYGSEGPDYNTYTALKTALNTVTSAAPGKLTTDGNNLVQLALSQVLRQVGNPSPGGPPQPPPPTPKVTITSPVSRALSLPVGSTATITASVVDVAQGGTPLANYNVPLQITSGPNAGTQATLTSDANGTVTYSYASANTGVDVVSLLANVTPAAGVRPLVVVKNPAADAASVVWDGGPDLVINEFTPPVVNWASQASLHLTDTTTNIGNVAEQPSTTQYFMSTQSPVDPTAAVLLGGRPVPTLQPGASNFYQIDLPVPSQFQSPGTYYLLACANGNRAVAETNYQNNCQTRQATQMIHQTVVPPVCTSAAPSEGSIWPPNHKYVSENVVGVTDPNRLAVTITISGIQQDEPVLGIGSGNTAPDATGVGTSTAQVRAERSGTGNGRIYFISFGAVNTAGGQCAGTVQAGVPHDQGQGSTPVDTGYRYDSTVVPL